MLTTTSTPRPAASAVRTGDRRAITGAVLTLAGARPVDGAAARVPCAARPSTRFVHDDGPCRCFFGGPAPLLAAPLP
ncbi:hypothetical protein [Actinotalea solisilvae]|uniref:hypothetical protein n=1 Tax=Actinotalea solisilvae TaxID=2072922 RepID=UPI0018F1A636|nr:hypothetical protein [Actinotalea solisilvae]